MAAKIEAAKLTSFAQCVEEYLETHESAWKNRKHRDQWRSTLATYAHPIIGKLPVAAVDTALVLKVLRPIWNKKPETASRLRGRIERILAWATVSEYRQGENPARWRGHLAGDAASQDQGAQGQASQRPALCRRSCIHG